MAETPRFAHLAALLFFGAGLCLIVALLAVLYGALRKWRWLAIFGGSGALLTAGGYAVVLLATGLFSGQRVLSPGQWKYFCEADCHIAYAIEDVRTASTLGPEAKLIGASGNFVIVRLKTWFDENSISRYRGNAPLRPVPRRVLLLDADGRTFSPLPQADSMLGAPSTPLTQPLRPGESYLTSFVFDVPRQAQDLRLLISDDDPVARFIIDHENSPFHGKIFLALGDLGSPTHHRLR